MTYCEQCGCSHPGKPRQRFCEDCMEMRQAESRARTNKTKEYKIREVGYVVVYDPSPYPLEPGKRLPCEEHRSMLALKTYTPGTVVEKSGQRYVVKVFEGKMKAVRI